MKSHSLLRAKLRTYQLTTMGMPLFMVLGIIAFITCLVLFFSGAWDGAEIRAMLYLNGAISIFMIGYALAVYRGFVLIDIARQIRAHGAPGTATILSSAYNGVLERDHSRHWYKLKLDVHPHAPETTPFTVDIEQLFHMQVEPELKAGKVVPVQFVPECDLFALIMIEMAEARLK